jgi:phage baseplate assembly protein V
MSAARMLAPQAPGGPDVLEIIQAIVREELATRRFAEVGVVTELFAHEGDGDKLNCECAVRLRGSDLELPRVPVATQRVGLAAIPNVDDLVLVSFVGGDLHAPVIVGRLYNDVDRPPVAKATECVYVSPDAAESGVRRAYLEFPNANTLLLDDDKIVVDAGGTKITISNAGDVKIESKAKVVVKSEDAVEVDAKGDITLKAGGALTLKAGGDVKIEGQSVAAKAQTTAQLEGGAGATVKGPSLSLKGTTSFSAG